MAQPYLNELERIVDGNRPAVGEIVCKHFFSGAAVYLNGVICASLSPKGLAFKLSGERSAELIEQGEAIPLQYFEKSPVKKGYALFPEAGKLSPIEISAYFNECFKHSRGA